MPHIHEQYDFVIVVFIVYKDTVLLVQHPRYNKWLPIGGHVELNEDPEEALYREVKEESGLEVTILADLPKLESEDGVKFVPSPSFIDVHDANPPHKHISLTYFATTTDPNPKKSNEHTDMRWFSATDIEDPTYNLLPTVKFYCHEALSRAK